MDLQPGLQQLADQHNLSPAAAARLNALAAIGQEPKELERTVPFGVAILAAALGGMGIIFWIAANWESLSRAGRFSLLQSVIVIMCAGAVLRPAARPALALIALLGIGGLFALFRPDLPDRHRPLATVCTVGRVGAAAVPGRAA